MPLAPEQVVQFQHELTRLKQEHKELGLQIEQLLEEAALHPLTLHKLKKEKLSLKDRIAKLEALLVPDIIA